MVSGGSITRHPGRAQREPGPIERRGRFLQKVQMVAAGA